MSTLFPHNFPKFVASYSVIKNKEKLSGTVRSKVKTKQASEAWGNDLDKESKYPFSKAYKVANDLKLPFLFDAVGVNYGIGSDGGVYYLDRIILGKSKLQPENVLKWMKKNHYEEKDKELVRNAMDRFLTLTQQSQKET